MSRMRCVIIKGFSFLLGWYIRFMKNLVRKIAVQEKGKIVFRERAISLERLMIRLGLRVHIIYCIVLYFLLFVVISQMYFILLLIYITRIPL